MQKDGFLQKWTILKMENTSSNINETTGYAKAILVGLDLNSKEDFEHSMQEMESLCEACNLDVCCTITQKLPHPEAGTYLGSGKVDEVAMYAKNLEAEYCVFEANLSPAQQKNLQNIIGIPVWDRTNLILEIFSRRAKTREARLQVESAYLQYMLPRLSGMWQHLGRQGGGSGSMSNKGVGETQIELDRRHIKSRIAELGRELKAIAKTRDTQRMGRKKGAVPLVAMVGYTNAGKSTLMNKLLRDSGSEEDKSVFEKDMLFATLDTSIRRITFGDNKDFLLSDTVGFIEDLPHGLIKAFRSTLEEAANADLLLIVLDSSDPYWRQHRLVAEDTLKELNADKIPRIYVMNKADVEKEANSGEVRLSDKTVYVSARRGNGIDELVAMIKSELYARMCRMNLLIPYKNGELVSKLHEKANITLEEYREDGTYIEADCPEQIVGELSHYQV